MEGNAGVEVRGQASGDRYQGTGFRGYRLLIIKHLLSIEKIFIRTLSFGLEHPFNMGVASYSRDPLVLFLVGVCYGY